MCIPPLKPSAPPPGETNAASGRDELGSQMREGSWQEPEPSGIIKKELFLWQHHKNDTVELQKPPHKQQTCFVQDICHSLRSQAGWPGRLLAATSWG